MTQAAEAPRQSPRKLPAATALGQTRGTVAGPAAAAPQPRPSDLPRLAVQDHGDAVIPLQGEAPQQLWVEAGDTDHPIDLVWAQRRCPVQRTSAAAGPLWTTQADRVGDVATRGLEASGVAVKPTVKRLADARCHPDGQHTQTGLAKPTVGRTDHAAGLVVVACGLHRWLPRDTRSCGVAAPLALLERARARVLMRPPRRAAVSSCRACSAAASFLT